MSAETNATDLISRALGEFFITGSVMQVAEWRRKNPWRWERWLSKWRVEMIREELLAKIHARKENTQMLTVTGQARLENEAEKLWLEAVVQPHFPIEHEQLAKIAAANPLLQMIKGQLVLRMTFHSETAINMPTQEVISGPLSVGTLLSDEDEGGCEEAGDLERMTPEEIAEIREGIDADTAKAEEELNEKAQEVVEEEHAPMVEAPNVEEPTENEQDLPRALVN